MILTPDQTVQALATTTLNIKILDEKGNRIATVSASEAAELLTRKPYTVKGTLRRVKQLRECASADARPFPIDLHYQDGRGVMKFWRDQRSSGGHSRAA